MPKPNPIVPCALLGACVLALYASPLQAGWTWSGSAQAQLAAQAQRANPALAAWQAGGLHAQGYGKGAALESRFGLRYASEDPERLTLGAHVSALARASSSEDQGRKLGLLEAFVDIGALDFEGWRIRTGLSFAGTSRENSAAFWQTPYTLSLSALNSWIGEEFRPLGIGFAKRWQGAQQSLDLETQIYQGNDTGPALLAWRGFALHNRLSVLGEIVPLPPLTTLRPGMPFGDQRSDGTQPFGPDLDGRLGYSLRLRVQSPELSYSLFVTDNRGDQDLHDGDEYAWRNRFAIAGFNWQISPDWALLGEAMSGRTEMGFPPGPNVQARFNTQYLLLTRSLSDWTVSARVERFVVHEADFSAERNDQRGRAFTLAALRQVDAWNYGVEYQYADIERPGNAQIDFPTAQGGSQLTALIRWYWGE